jgi:hypothetical protein
MDYYAGIDVSLEASSVCVVDASGKILREAKVLSEPENLIGWFRALGLEMTRNRAGGGAFVAMAPCGHEGRRLGGGIAGNTARA